jgi:threonine dehydrogenase-like Zn-dependent dehydrogenase
MKAIRFNVSVLKYIALKVIGIFLKKAYFTGPLSTVKLVDIPVPELPGDEWIKIKVLCCGVCGSDLGSIFLKNSPEWTPYSSFPSILGHEISGRIVETGSRVKNFKKGDIVTVCPLLNCEVKGLKTCRACSLDMSVCENFGEGLSPGMILDACKTSIGGYSEYIVAHKSQVYRLPGGISVRSGAMIEPFAIALEAVFGNMPQKGDHVLVMGGGVIGNMIVRAVRALDIDCYVTSVVSSRFTAELSRKAGADNVISGSGLIASSLEITKGKRYRPLIGQDSMMGGYSHVFDCFSTSKSVKESLGIVRTGGVITLIGLSNVIKFDPTLILIKAVTIKSALYYGSHIWKGKKRHMFDLAIELLTKKKAELESLITHEMRIADLKKMIDINMHKSRHGAVKTMYVFD